MAKRFWLASALLLAASLAILSGRGARIAAWGTALLIFVGALIWHLPVVAGDALLAPSWTSAGKALTLCGGALALAGTLPPVPGLRPPGLARLVNRRHELVAVGRWCLAIFLLITGVQHFLYTPFVASLIPGWFPGDPVFWTRCAGIALIAGGLGLLLPRTATLAALLSGCMVFSWFWIIHVPLTFRSVSDGIAVYEALAVAGIAWLLAGFGVARTADPASHPSHPGGRHI